MRGAVSFVATAVVVLVVSGCGGTDDDAASGESVAPAATAVASTETSATTEASDDTAPLTTETEPTAVVPVTTAAPATVVPATTAPATAASASTSDCLNGNWRTESPELQRFIDAVGIPMSITIEPGSFWSATIDNGTFVADSEVAFSAAIPGGGMTLSASGGYHMEGTYTVDGNTIVAETVVREGATGEWSATINGVSISLPAGVAMGAPPDAAAPDFNGSTFTCNDTTLVFNVPGAPIPDITYTRVA